MSSQIESMPHPEIIAPVAAQVLTVSIALCTFNGEQFLQEQLQSLLRQDYPIAELVVFDDNSTDSTHQILAAFKVQSVFPVKVHINDRNVGVIANFEKAIAGCSGDLIALADQDDVWLPNKLTVIVGHFLRNPRCGYIFSDAELIDERGQPLSRSLWQSVGLGTERQALYAGRQQLEPMLRGGNFVYGTTLVFRSVFRSELLPIRSMSLACTHDTWISLYLSATGRYGIAVPIALVQYRQHQSQLFGGGKRLSAFERIKALVKSRPDMDEGHIQALLALASCVRNNRPSDDGAADSADALTEMAVHLRARNLAAACRRIYRLKIVFAEIRARRYGKYSSSSLSIVKDLLLPMRRLPQAKTDHRV